MTGGVSPGNWGENAVGSDSTGNTGGAAGCHGSGELISGGGAADCGCPTDCRPVDCSATDGDMGATGGCMGNVVGCRARVGAMAAIIASALPAGGGALVAAGATSDFRFSKN